MYFVLAIREYQNTICFLRIEYASCFGGEERESASFDVLAGSGSHVNSHSILIMRLSFSFALELTTIMVFYSV